MGKNIVITLAICIVAVAYLIARNAQRNGLPFWRTMIMAVIGLTGVTLLFINLLD